MNTVCVRVCLCACVCVCVLSEQELTKVRIFHFNNFLIKLYGNDVLLDSKIEHCNTFERSAFAFAFGLVPLFFLSQSLI